MTEGGSAPRRWAFFICSTNNLKKQEGQMGMAQTRMTMSTKRQSNPSQVTDEPVSALQCLNFGKTIWGGLRWAEELRQSYLAETEPETTIKQ
jgi:hypothetical protein